MAEIRTHLVRNPAALGGGRLDRGRPDGAGREAREGAVRAAEVAASDRARVPGGASCAARRGAR